MVNRIIVVLFSVAVFSTVNACQNPDNVFCVMFKYDSSYPVDLTLFDTIGDEGVNYFHDSMSNKDIIMNKSQDVYSYRSHYNDYVLIEVASGGINFVIDTSGINIDALKADSCVAEELKWLNLAGIVQINRVDREAIAGAFTNSFKSMIYWTKWDTLTGSDMIVADSSGTFTRVRCSSDFTINFPAQPLEYSTGIIDKKNTHNPGRSVNYNNGREGKAVFIDIHGRKIHNSENLKLNNSNSAIMIIRYDSETGVVNRSTKMR